MDNLLQAAKQALEALEDMNNGWKYIRQMHGDLYGVGWDRAEGKADKAYEALRQAIAQAELKENEDVERNVVGLKAEQQEPVGYWDGKFSKGGASALYEVPQESAFGYHYENYPLYAAPVRTKDLTNEEIETIFEYWYSQPETEVWSTVDLARAVIAADRELNK